MNRPTETYDDLGRGTVISGPTSEGMVRLAKLRNMIIHRYWEIDDARLYKEARGSGLRVIRNFITEVEEHASRH